MSISFARVASGTTTVAGTNTYSAYNPTATATSGLTGQNLNDYQVLHIFTKPYLDAHTLSFPSFRYSYYFWFVLAAAFVIWVVLHQLHFRFGVLGAAVRKLTLRKFALGRKSKGAGKQSTLAKQKHWSSITVGQLVGLAIFTLFVFLCCYIGPDYINPTDCMFSSQYCGYHPVNGDEATNQYQRKRALDTAGQVLGDAVGRLWKRRPARYGWSPLNDPLLSGPNFTIRKNFWASSSRVGLIAYAMLPLSVGLALKQWPMNPFAAPFLTNLGVDKTAFWHRWSGRIIWAMSTVHTGLWTKQMFIDINPFNEPTWNVAWAWHRLVAGGVAYGFLTLMVILSFKPFRARFYELFYYSHVALVLGFLVAIIIHYQALQGWGLTAACLWGLERIVRACLFLWLNYGPGLPLWGEGRLGRAQFTSRDASGGSFKVHHVEKRLSAEGQKFANQAQDIYGNEEWSAASKSTANLQDSLSVPASAPRPVYAYGPGNDEVGEQGVPYGAAYSPRSPFRPILPGASPSSPMKPGPVSRTRTLYRSQPIPKGYALVQILPGRVLKLTLHTPRHLSWKPGQYVNLTTPSVRWWQSHPYTISNAQNMTEGLLSRKPDGEEQGGSEMVLLMSMRRGYTRRLYNSIVSKRRRLVSPSYTDKDSEHAGGVLIRAQTYFPQGSAARARYDDFSTVVLVAAGSGITYTMAILEHLCYGMYAKDAALRGDEPSWTTRKRAKPTKTSRVRFVWVLKEYSHLAWIAPALRRCLDISDPSRLRIDLFVTQDLTRPNERPLSNLPYHSSALMEASASKDTELFQPPRPGFIRHQPRSASMDSNASDQSRTIVDDEDFQQRYHNQLSTDNEGTDFSVTEMILFDGEEDHPTSPVDREISRTVKKEGKLRRALSRKKTRSARTQAHPSDDEAVPARLHSRTPSNLPSPTPLSHQYPPESISRRDSDYSLHSRAASASIGLSKNDSSFGIPLLGDAEVGNLDLDQSDMEDLHVIAELARGGRPDLGGIFDQEIERSQGPVAVGCCGPSTLNNLVREMVAKRINVGRVAKGDDRGNVELIIEDFNL